jgi:hypothetical protein
MLVPRHLRWRSRTECALFTRQLQKDAIVFAEKHRSCKSFHNKKTDASNRKANKNTNISSVFSSEAESIWFCCRLQETSGQEAHLSLEEEAVDEAVQNLLVGFHFWLSI